MNLLARPSEWTRTGKDAPATPFAGGAQHYLAFLSYSHRDEATAKWLHNELERFRVPSHLVGRITEHGAVPRRLTPIFRDLMELPASTDLGAEIREAIAASQFLIVLCSPAAAQSRWTNAEVEFFKRVRPEGCVLAAVIAGEPFASDMPGREAEECLPRALRFKYDRRGRATAKAAEPLAADLRKTGPARRLGFLKLVAGMLGVGLDDLVHREAVRKHQRLALLTAAAIAGMTITSGLAVTAIQARDAARDQRREAEGLIGFMLGDLRSKLEPVGRLDALDGVGSRVLAYYQKQDLADLSDGALSQRSRALGMMGEIANLRGDSDGAARLYSAALAGTGEAVNRSPNDPERLFEHAQNVFAVGELARQRGQLNEALAAFREYKRLAARMVELGPDNMRWRMETQYADANLGIVFYARRQFDDATRAFSQSLNTIEGLASANPGNPDYQKGRIESLAWLADAQLAAGHLDQAIALRRRQISILERLLAASNDVEYREKLVSAYRALGNAYGFRGETGEALANLRAAVDHSDRLIAVEPANRMWRGDGARARIDLARFLLSAGDKAGADAAAQAGCEVNDQLLRQDSTVVDWRHARRDCLTTRTQVALAQGDSAGAVLLAGQALRAAQSVNNPDPIENRFALGRAFRLLGDARARAGAKDAARAAWQAGLDQLPASATEKPMEMNEHALLLQRLGRTAKAEPLTSRLSAIGYRPGA